MNRQKPYLPPFKNTSIEDLPPELARRHHETGMIIGGYLYGLSLISKDAARDPNFAKSHLLTYLGQDLIEAAVSIRGLVLEGVHRVVKREMRFILEASVKLASVQQSSYSATISERLTLFEQFLSSSKVSVGKAVNLRLLDESLQGAFIEEVGRLYGTTSSYVHWTPFQITERIQAVEEGRVAGQESPKELDELNILLSKTLAASLVLLLHSVPDFIAGDILVEQNGETTDWYFNQSRFIAAIDAKFDYKHERQQYLTAIQELRKSRLRF